MPVSEGLYFLTGVIIHTSSTNGRTTRGPIHDLGPHTATAYWKKNFVLSVRINVISGLKILTCSVLLKAILIRRYFCEKIFFNRLKIWDFIFAIHSYKILTMKMFRYLRKEQWRIVDLFPQDYSFFVFNLV